MHVAEYQKSIRCSYEWSIRWFLCRAVSACERDGFRCAGCLRLWSEIRASSCCIHISKGVGKRKGKGHTLELEEHI